MIMALVVVEAAVMNAAAETLMPWWCGGHEGVGENDISKRCS